MKGNDVDCGEQVSRRRTCTGMVAALSGIVISCFAARTASATTYLDFQMQGNSCISISNALTPQYTQWGVNAGNTAITVTCPLVIPSFVYTLEYLYVQGYNRSWTDHVSCTLSGTDFDGTGYFSVSASLPSNAASSQFSTVEASVATGLVYITCHLPAQTSSGSSHLTSIFVELGY